MPEDYYPAAGGDEPQPTGTDAGAKEPADDKAEGETFLVPKSAFEGQELNPGDQFYFTIVKVHGDEVEVKYSHDESKEDYGGKPEMGESMKGMESLASSE